MQYRFVREDLLLRQVALGNTGPALRRWLQRQRTAPDLVGATRAAEILGVQPPHLARLRRQGRMPEPIPVDGSVDVYLREEVVALGRQLERERKARARKRGEG